MRTGSQQPNQTLSSAAGSSHGSRAHPKKMDTHIYIRKYVCSYAY